MRGNALVDLAARRSQQAVKRGRLRVRSVAATRSALREEAALYFWSLARDIRAGRESGNAALLAEILPDVALLHDMEQHPGLRKRCAELLTL